MTAKWICRRYLSETGRVFPALFQIRRIDMLLDGEIDADKILNTYVSGDNLPLYTTSYNAVKKMLTIDFEKPLSENKSYVII